MANTKVVTAVVCEENKPQKHKNPVLHGRGLGLRGCAALRVGGVAHVGPVAIEGEELATYGRFR